jgi:hypothetical protein
MLWVAPIGDRRSYAILARNFLVENSTNKKLTKFPEYLSQVVDTRRIVYESVHCGHCWLTDQS